MIHHASIDDSVSVRKVAENEHYRVFKCDGLRNLIEQKREKIGLFAQVRVS